MDDREYERRIALPELTRMVQRIDHRTAAIYDALFVSTAASPALFTRVALMEQARADDHAERNLARIMAAVATLVGSTAGAIVAAFSWHRP